jgi:hypothetical protein
MNPLQTIIFLIFVLPFMVLKKGWKMLTKNITKDSRNKWLWRIPSFLLIILSVLAIILWLKGYR